MIFNWFGSALHPLAPRCRERQYNFQLEGWHRPLSKLMRVLPQEPGRIEHYNHLFRLCGHFGGVSEIQTSLDVSDL